MNEWKKEGMKETDSCIPPNLKLIKPISKQFAINRRFTTEELSIYRSTHNCLFFHRHFVTFTSSTCFPSSFKLHFSLPTFSPRHLRYVHAGYLCNWQFLNTNYVYYGIIFGRFPGSFNFKQIECMCSQIIPHF